MDRAKIAGGGHAHFLPFFPKPALDAAIVVHAQTLQTPDFLTRHHLFEAYRALLIPLGFILWGGGSGDLVDEHSVL